MKKEDKYSIIQQGDTTEYGILSLSFDKRDDYTYLPINVKSGSTAICLEDSSVWMLNLSNQWKEI